MTITKKILLVYSALVSIFIPVSALMNNQSVPTLAFAIAFSPIPLFLLGTIVLQFRSSGVHSAPHKTSRLPLVAFSLLLLSLLGISGANIFFSTKKIEDENNHPVRSRESEASPTPTPNIPKKRLEVIAPAGEKTINVRNGPSTGSEVVDEVTPGDVFEYTEKVSGWYKIILINNQEGWIKETYAKAVNLL